MKNLKIITSLLLAFCFVAVVASVAEVPQHTLPMFGVVLFLAQFSNVKSFAGSLLEGVIDVTDLTFNGEEIKSLKDAIFTAVFTKPDLNEFHTIVSGIKAKKQIAILGLLGLVGKKQTGCTTDANEGQIGMSEKFWNPEYIGDRFEQCWADLKETFFVWGLNNGVKKADLTNTDFANFLEDRLGDAIDEMILRLVWFSDTDAALVDDLGNVTDGTDLDFFNPIDGLWKQIFAIAAATPARKATIAKNAEATFALQKFDAGDTTDMVVTGLFEEMLYGADERLREKKNIVIVATQSVVDQYRRELKSIKVDASFVKIEAGFKAIMFEGVTVIAFPFWDRMIRTYFSTGVKYHLPHRALLTTKENLQIGTEEEGTLKELDPFYDKKAKTYVVDFGSNLDAKVIEDHMLQVAY